MDKITKLNVNLQRYHLILQFPLGLTKHCSVFQLIVLILQHPAFSSEKLDKATVHCRRVEHLAVREM